MKEEFDKELRELSPLLAYLKKEQEGDSFKVPKFYFDNLADKVIAQAKETQKVGMNPKKETPQYPTLLSRLQGFVGELFSPRLALAFGSCLIIAVAAWFMLSSKKAGTPVDNAAVSVTPSSNMGQLANPVEPTSGAINPAMEEQMLKNGQKNAAISDNKPNSSPNEAPFSHQNATKLGETAEQNTLADGQLVHPQSGLTEEELAMYLEENMDENDSSDMDDLDSSDNNL